MPRWFDVTLPLQSGMVAWPGDPPFERQEALTVCLDGVAVSRLTLGSHTGTHVDAPRHLWADGVTVDHLPLDVLCGPARVLTLEERRSIGADDLERALAGDDPQRLLLRTDNSRHAGWSAAEFRMDYVALEPDAADWLVDRGVRLVGLDALSVDRWDAEGLPVHRRLLAAGTIIIEGLDLSAVPPGTYELVCLPLLIRGGDGAPARVVLRGE